MSAEQIEIALLKLLQKHTVPQPVVELLEKCQVGTIAKFACFAQSQEEISGAILPEIPGHNDLPFPEKAMMRAATTAEWEEAKVVFRTSITPKAPASQGDDQTEEAISADVRQTLLGRFQEKYGHPLPLEVQPSRVVP